MNKYLAPAIVGIFCSIGFAMAQVSISNLPSSPSLTGGEAIPSVQGSTTYKATPNQIRNIPGSPVTGIWQGSVIGQTFGGAGTISGILKADGSGNVSAAVPGTDFGTVSSVGLSLPSIFTVSGSPVTGSGTLTGTLNTESANTVWAGPSTGAAAMPTFRSLAIADLPTGIPNANLANVSTTVNGQTCTLGASCTISAAASSLVVGTTTITSGTANGLLYDNAGALGNLATINSGVLITSGAGAPSISTTLPNGLALGTPASITLTNGTGLPINGGVSGLGTGVATLLGGSASGTGGPAGTTSPAFVTPTLGAATATTINKLTLTAPASAATLTIANGKTATISNTLTFTGTDSSSIAFGTGGTIGPVGYAVAGQIPGDTSGASASSPNVGQLISSNIPLGSAVAATTATAINITSITITPGDWDCWGNVASSLAGTTVPTLFVGAISTGSATLPTAPNSGSYFQISGVTFAAGSNELFPVGRIRIATSGTVIVYLVGRLDFTTSTASLYGYLGCSRAR